VFILTALVNGSTAPIYSSSNVVVVDTNLTRFRLGCLC
jgi:hypothetical protein